MLLQSNTFNLKWFHCKCFKLPAQWQFLYWFTHFVQSCFVGNCITIVRCDCIWALTIRCVTATVYVIVMPDFCHFNYFNGFIVLSSVSIFWEIRWKCFLFRIVDLIRFTFIHVIVSLFHQTIFGIMQHSQFHENIFYVLTFKIVQISGALAEF